ncbi:hypothetical protein Y1Q_0005072 [Alligator mississippiensis]|uniref:G-protein coupled receptors family 1 profile domain-containing protein n=1 Tax=Alligator mississippiensis TaxID=8496 RepID=A0A151MU72_ALLMI|nr:hypothetical protein Y1Q_0005072 [Alligator mississippiensis]
MYLLSLCGNAAVAVIVCTNCSLHTPVYFFLANLAVLEICYSSVIAPLALANLLYGRKATISLAGCGTQMFFFVFLGGADCILLAVMAFDRYEVEKHKEKDAPPTLRRKQEGMKLASFLDSAKEMAEASCLPLGCAELPVSSGLLQILHPYEGSMM